MGTMTIDELRQIIKDTVVALKEGILDVEECRANIAKADEAMKKIQAENMKLQLEIKAASLKLEKHSR